MKTYTVNDIECIVGENAHDNWKILSNAKQNDLFFHLSKFSSCYVIAKCENPIIEEIRDIARICRDHTKYKFMHHISVDYTLCKNVVKSENVGEVNCVVV